MESRRQSFCDHFNQYVYSSYNYIKAKIIIPINQNKSWSLQAIAYLGIIGYVGAKTAMTVGEQTDDISYIVARTAGAMAKPAVLAVALPILPALTSSLQESGIGEYLGLKNRIISHKLIAYSIVGVGVVHSVAHYFYNKDNYLKQPGITGMFMLGCLALPLGGVYFAHWMQPNSEYSYGLRVINPHKIAAGLSAGALVVHTTDFRLLPYAGAVVGVYALDQLYNYFSYKHNVSVKSIKKIENTNQLLLRVTIPPNYKIHNYLAGQFVKLFLKDPAMNRVGETGHPFTIAGMNKKAGELYLVVKENGWWTKNLSNHSTQKDMPATLWGPYGSPLNSFYKQSKMTVITAGIGMTPFLAYVFWLIEQRRTSPVLSINITLAKIEELFLWIKALNDPNIKRINFIDSVNVYITQQKTPEIETWLAKITPLKNLKFFLPEKKEEPVLLVAKEEKKQEPEKDKEAPHSNYENILDDDFHTFEDDSDDVSETATTNSPVQRDVVIDVQEAIEQKNQSQNLLSSVTPDTSYPALNTTGFFSTKEQQRTHLTINVYNRRMDINQTLNKNKFFDTAAVCAGDRMVKEVTKAASANGIKLYKESF